MSLVHFTSSSLREGRWSEYLLRFSLGGAATVFTGIVASKFGASIGGLFLALPAIFCASATLIETHEIRAKREANLDGRRRGEKAAALDAVGASLGAVGLMGFAAIFRVLVTSNVAAAFLTASVGWLAISVTVWLARSAFRKDRRQRISRQHDIGE